MSLSRLPSMDGPRRWPQCCEVSLSCAHRQGRILLHYFLHVELMSSTELPAQSGRPAIWLAWVAEASCGPPYYCLFAATHRFQPQETAPCAKANHRAHYSSRARGRREVRYYHFRGATRRSATQVVCTRRATGRKGPCAAIRCTRLRQAENERSARFLQVRRADHAA